MSAWYQSFVVLDALDTEEADALRARVLQPLVTRGVFLAEADGAWPAGPAHELIVVPHGHHPRGYLRASRGDGAGGRGVFGTGGTGTRCPACDHRLELFDDPADRSAWQDAVDGWWRGADGALTCRHCLATRSVVDWPADEPLGFGYFAFELWDFARLNDSFVAEMTRAIGVPAILIVGKL